MPKPSKARARTSAQLARMTRAAVEHGRRQARTVLAQRKKAMGAGRRGPKGLNGLILAEGDSWFDYPFYDVLERLEDDFDFRVESVAHKGDTVEEMAHDVTQRGKLARMFEKVSGDGKVPRAILLSGGGNDIAGQEFGVLLNHAAAVPVLGDINENVVTGVIDERVRFAIVSVISAVTALSQNYFNKKVPVIIHGYGYPVPDGRGYLGGFSILPGPWLQPGFLQKGYLNSTQKDVDLPRCTGIMKRLINRFNDMVKSIPGQPDLQHVSYLDLRSELSNDLPGYKASWENELHPTKAGFDAVAKVFRDRILTFPRP